jgi:hypothetical protein
MKLEANKTYVFKDSYSRQLYKKSHKNNAFYIENSYKNGFTLSHAGVDVGWGNGRLLIGKNEIQYFKLKETSMLKPDDKISVEMTALDAVRIRTIFAKSRSNCSDACGLLKTLNKIISDKITSDYLINIPFSDLQFFYLDNEFHKACIKLFKNPMEERIDALKKTIEIASEQIALIRSESDSE